MKCAPAVMRSSSVRSVLLSIQIVNQAGTWGVTNETTHTARPATVSLPRRCGLTGLVTQKGITDRIGDCGDSRHGCPGVLSQRRLPMMIAWVSSLLARWRRLGGTGPQAVEQFCVAAEGSHSLLTAV